MWPAYLPLRRPFGDCRQALKVGRLSRSRVQAVIFKEGEDALGQMSRYDELAVLNEIKTKMYDQEKRWLYRSSEQAPHLEMGLP